jgi:hypothetical protein
MSVTVARTPVTEILQKTAEISNRSSYVIAQQSTAAFEIGIVTITVAAASKCDLTPLLTS